MAIARALARPPPRRFSRPVRIWGATIVPDDARLQTAETDTKVRQLWKLGLPGKEIARILKLPSARAVYGRMWRMGIRRPPIVSIRNRFDAWDRRRLERIAERWGNQAPGARRPAAAAAGRMLRAAALARARRPRVRLPGRRPERDDAVLLQPRRTQRLLPAAPGGDASSNRSRRHAANIAISINKRAAGPKGWAASHAR